MIYQIDSLHLQKIKSLEKESVNIDSWDWPELVQGVSVIFSVGIKKFYCILMY